MDSIVGDDAMTGDNDKMAAVETLDKDRESRNERIDLRNGGGESPSRDCLVYLQKMLILLAEQKYQTYQRFAMSQRL